MDESKIYKNFFLVLVLMTLLPSVAHADGLSNGRQKNLDFEDQTVEGVNKQPLDTFNQISEGDGNRKKSHLYWKLEHFRRENGIAMKNLRWTE